MLEKVKSAFPEVRPDEDVESVLVEHEGPLFVGDNVVHASASS